MDRDNVIFICHEIGFKQWEIVNILRDQYDIRISERHLRRILQKHNLYRRKNLSDIESVSNFIAENLEKSGQQLGYRSMHLRCTLAGFRVSMESVRVILRLLDPEGVELRRRRRLVRRRYYAKGPNYLWHVDSYDKLKPYGIAINGCVDGFSRYIVWLQCNYTSSDPKVVGGYFINAVEQMSGCPTRMRGDRGTENSFIHQMQTIFNDMQTGFGYGEISFMYGRSTANQRIENFWSFFRRQLSEFWIGFFHEMKENGHFNGEAIEKELIRFVFMDLIQVKC